MYFTKMHGLGNDYIYLDCMAGPMPDHLPELSQKLSHRHFGIGADGIICILPSTCAAARMRIFNADGSEGEMCGNGIRCVGKLLFDQGYVRENAFAIETRAGVKYLTLQRRGGNVEQVTVDMGRPLLSPPLTLDIARETYTVTPVSMGNPHAVVFLPEIATLPLADLGPLFEHHSIFPNRINTEFVAVRDRTLLEMRVWERGSGETMACGTGACAALAAAVTGGYTDRRALVRLAGGRFSDRVERTDRQDLYDRPCRNGIQRRMERWPILTKIIVNYPAATYLPKSPGAWRTIPRKTRTRSSSAWASGMSHGP